MPPLLDKVTANYHASAKTKPKGIEEDESSQCEAEGRISEGDSKDEDGSEDGGEEMPVKPEARDNGVEEGQTAGSRKASQAGWKGD